MIPGAAFPDAAKPSVKCFACLVGARSSRLKLSCRHSRSAAAVRSKPSAAPASFEAAP